MIELKHTYSGGDIEDTEGAYDGFKIIVDGEVVGSTTVHTWADGSALIERLDIDDEQQCKGYGTGTIRMISDAHDTTYIVPDSERSARLYERLGRDVSDDALWGALDQGFGVYRV